MPAPLSAPRREAAPCPCLPVVGRWNLSKSVGCRGLSGPVAGAGKVMRPVGCAGLSGPVVVGNLSGSVGCVDLGGPAAGLGGIGAPPGYAAPRRQSTQGIRVNRRVPGLRGRKRWSRRNQSLDFWSLAVVWGSRGKRMGTWPVWESEVHGDLRGMGCSVWLTRCRIADLRLFVNCRSHQLMASMMNFHTMHGK